MTKARRHHSAKDVEAKLRQANEMAARGSTQKEISQALGISIMTYHRWRRSQTDHSLEESVSTPVEAPALPTISRPQQQSLLELENRRLRRLVTDLLLEKMVTCH
jgi:transposase-like protein